jgi:hypothetical protein
VIVQKHPKRVKEHWYEEKKEKQKHDEIRSRQTQVFEAEQ